MNSKLCKLLRRQARLLSTECPERRTIVDPKQRYPQDWFDRQGFLPTMINDPKTYRGVYRALKRAA